MRVKVLNDKGRHDAANLFVKLAKPFKSADPPQPADDPADDPADKVNTVLGGDTPVDPATDTEIDAVADTVVTDIAAGEGVEPTPALKAMVKKVIGAGVFIGKNKNPDGTITGPTKDDVPAADEVNSALTEEPSAKTKENMDKVLAEMKATQDKKKKDKTAANIGKLRGAVQAVAAIAKLQAANKPADEPVVPGLTEGMKDDKFLESEEGKKCQEIMDRIYREKRNPTAAEIKECDELYESWY